MAIPVLAAIMFAGAFTPIAMAAGADPEQAADVEHNLNCTLGTTIFGYGTSTNTVKSEVWTNNEDGTSKFTCQGVLDNPALAPETAMKHELACFYINGETGDSVNTTGILLVTPSGHAKLTCRG